MDLLRRYITIKRFLNSPKLKNRLVKNILKVYEEMRPLMLRILTQLDKKTAIQLLMNINFEYSKDVNPTMSELAKT